MKTHTKEYATVTGFLRALQGVGLHGIENLNKQLLAVQLAALHAIVDMGEGMDIKPLPDFYGDAFRQWAMFMAGKLKKRPEPDLGKERTREATDFAIVLRTVADNLTANGSYLLASPGKKDLHQANFNTLLKSYQQALKVPETGYFTVTLEDEGKIVFEVPGENGQPDKRYRTTVENLPLIVKETAKIKSGRNKTFKRASTDPLVPNKPPVIDRPNSQTLVFLEDENSRHFRIVAEGYDTYTYNCSLMASFFDLDRQLIVQRRLFTFQFRKLEDTDMCYLVGLWAPNPGIIFQFKKYYKLKDIKAKNILKHGHLEFDYTRSNGNPISLLAQAVTGKDGEDVYRAVLSAEKWEKSNFLADKIRKEDNAIHRLFRRHVNIWPMANFNEELEDYYKKDTETRAGQAIQTLI